MAIVFRRKRNRRRMVQCAVWLVVTVTVSAWPGQSHDWAWWACGATGGYWLAELLTAMGV